MRKNTILFICTHNSARSQMAEGLVNNHLGNFNAFSAGIEQSNVNPYAIKAMNLVGIDISLHHSKLLKEFLGIQFDYVVTVCDNARKLCPHFPNTKQLLHATFEDPSTIKGNPQAILNKFIEIRNEIKTWIDHNLIG